MSDRVPVIETLGCRLNAYESEAIKALSREAGLGDAVVLNTCAVTAEAVRRAKQKIRRLRRENADQTIIVTGCAAQIDPGVFADMPEVDHVVGNVEKLNPKTWQQLGTQLGPTNEARVQVTDIMAEKQAVSPIIDGFGTRSRAYVQIQNGCDHRCTFCIIPYGRGNSRSVQADHVVEQIKRLVDQGFLEVVLTGVDMTSWGADLEGAPRLGELVSRILIEVPDLPRLRISSIDSIEADPQLIECIAGRPRLMPHLHLSLQAGDDMVLKRMKRRHLRGDAIEFCNQIKKARPDIVFGADIIVGFPTETDAMFKSSVRLVMECDLTWLHVFPYSIRQGTPAAKMPQVDRAVIKDRAARLRDIGSRQVERYLESQIGQDHSVLLENRRMGRTEGFAEVFFLEDQPVGKIVAVRISGYRGSQLTTLTTSNTDFSNRRDQPVERLKRV